MSWLIAILIGVLCGVAGAALIERRPHLLRRVPILPSPASLAARGSPFVSVPATTSHA